MNISFNDKKAKSLVLQLLKYYTTTACDVFGLDMSCRNHFTEITPSCLINYESKEEGRMVEEMPK